MSLVAYPFYLFLPQIQLLSQPSAALMWPVGSSLFSDHRATEESPAAESLWQYSPSPGPKIHFSGAASNTGLFQSYLESWTQRVRSMEIQSMKFHNRKFSRLTPCLEACSAHTSFFESRARMALLGHQEWQITPRFPSSLCPLRPVQWQPPCPMANGPGRFKRTQFS